MSKHETPEPDSILQIGSVLYMVLDTAQIRDSLRALDSFVKAGEPGFLVMDLAASDYRFGYILNSHLSYPYITPISVEDAIAKQATHE